MTKWITPVLFLFLVLASSCIKREVTFEGKTVVNANGSVSRSGALNIAAAKDETGTQDSTEAMKFFIEHFPVIDKNLFEVHSGFSDGILSISWFGILSPDDLPFTDYIHRVGESPAATNRISVDVKNRWFYKDYHYLETYSDPVDASKYYSLIEEKLAKASDDVLKSPSLKGLREPEMAAAIISDLGHETGVKLLKVIMDNPRILDSLSDQYDSYFEIAGDSLAGLAGVKLSSEEAGELLKDNLGAVWDTILTDHPEIFGSYGLADDEHRFKIEVFLPGCIKSGNADSTFENVAVWQFDNVDFFAGEKKLEVLSRDWAWVNVALGMVVVVVVFLLVLWPIRKKGIA